MKNITLGLGAALLLCSCASQTVKTSQYPPEGPSIQIAANSKIWVEATVEQGKITRLTQVAESTKPEITLSFDLSSLDDGMLLSVSNPLPSAIKYQIEMIDLKGKYYPTSSCPAMAGGGAYENWPHPIPKMEIKNFRLLKEGEMVGCE